MDPALTTAVISALGGIVTIVGWLARRHIKLIDGMEQRIEAERKERFALAQETIKKAEQQASQAAERARQEADEKRAQAELHAAMIQVQREQAAELRSIAGELRSLRVGQDRMNVVLEHEVDRMDIMTDALETVVGEDVMERARRRGKPRESQGGNFTLQGERLEAVATQVARRPRPESLPVPGFSR